MRSATRRLSFAASALAVLLSCGEETANGRAEVGADAEVLSDAAVQDGDAPDEPADTREDTSPDAAAPYGVPANGWADAVVDADVASTIEGDNGPITNVAADPEAALGAPEEDLTGNVALGPEGHYIIVDLGENEAACDGDGGDLVVVEIGFGQGGIPEAYEVSVSATASGAFEVVSQGFGANTFDLSNTAIVAPRYVRVESLATLDDVLHGLGSPQYPGPEIDAIGAIYPCPP